MNTHKFLCFNGGCLLRTREQNTEYIRKYRFTKKLQKIKAKEDMCHFCGGKVETLHHINENHADNRLENLMPLCHKCHLEVSHICDKPNYYQGDTLPDASRKPVKPVSKPKEAVTLKKTTKDILDKCVTGRVYNINLVKPGTSKRIHITEGSKKLVELFTNLGFTEVTV